MKSENHKNEYICGITSQECFSKLSKVYNSYLVDVRTTPEWKFIGVTDLSSIKEKIIYTPYIEKPAIIFSENNTRQ